jgi:transposase-like protein
LLGIGSRHRLTKELEQLLCSVVKDTSYAKAARTCNLFVDFNLSPRTVHKTVQSYGQKAQVVEDLSRITHLQTDSTKINAVPNERGIDVHLTLSIGASHKKGKRTIRQKTLAAIEVAKSPKKAKKVLKNSIVDQVIVDGRSGLERFIEQKKLPVTVQRCLWHIPHTSVHMLFQDGVSTTIGRELVRPMKEFLFNEKISVEKRLKKYDTLTSQFRLNQYESTCTFLENARKNLFTYKQFAEEDLYGRTNSIVERQMRELNRRMENGSRWTVPGAQNLLNLKFIEELNPVSYDYLWKLRKTTKARYQVILC